MTQDTSPTTKHHLKPAVGHRASLSYSPVRNRLAEQNMSPLNQTYTMGQRDPRPRSNSIDSEIADYNIQDAIAGRLPQPRSGKSSQSWTNRSVRNKSVSNTSSTMSRVFSSKLPSLDGCVKNRNCCQKYWTQTQMDLQKYKSALPGK
ncbi:hypothetical protein QR680_006889 [Steinernema hermaphroditum]|uniref:Uncharacterized protein n=1 Tax=Steinernema hermaphroditum TaxID=289476 RepID=A0AA39HWT8_9BILA|nr:hypothetical protein QR680_006889 [Steinernema hermaphroditum]